MIDTTVVDAVSAFDPDSGRLEIAAGASLDGVMHALVPRGWFPPVTPGTRHVTVGGAVAADIHGKNHHRSGSWCANLDGLTLATPGEGVVEVGPERDPELYWATAGGMGLTGVVLEATVRMNRIETSRALVDTDRTDDLDTCMEILAAGDEDYEYTVAWVDLLPVHGRAGRSVITRGRFATVDELAPAMQRDPLAFTPVPIVGVPPGVPSRLLNRWRIQAFNEAWYRRAPRRRRDEVQSIGRFFHPLDGVRSWNRLYGPQGFVQWQILVPFGAEETLRSIAAELCQQQVPTLIGVLKRFGAANPGPLSFPMPGWTLSLDIPAGIDGLGPLLDRLDERVAEAGGRVYLAKDSRLRPGLLPTMYPRVEEWRAVRSRVDPGRVLQSDLGRRLGLC